MNLNLYSLDKTLVEYITVDDILYKNVFIFIYKTLYLYLKKKCIDLLITLTDRFSYYNK
jgi:hypothetical protein